MFRGLLYEGLKSYLAVVWDRPHCRPFERRFEMQYRILIVDDSKLARMVMVSAFRRIRPEWELVEASNGVRHLLVIEHLTSEKVAAARSRLARAYERAIEVDDEILCV